MFTELKDLKKSQSNLYFLAQGFLPNFAVVERSLL